MGNYRKFSVTVGNIFLTVVAEILILVILWRVGWVNSLKTLMVFLSSISVILVASFLRAMRTVRCSHCNKSFRRHRAVWTVSGIFLGYQCPHCGAPFTQ
ncbi:MAG: hypothetical protein HY228_01290 [Candidatus Yonathbacteria bacterium]|nr:hypothetical protein [Candidatus Yonathbacteria bacterium]